MTLERSTWNVQNAESKVIDLILPDMELFPGAVAIAELFAVGWGTTKYRPVVLQGHHETNRWRVWKFTSNPHYAGGRGQPRKPIYGFDECGLNGFSYLWTPSLYVVDVKLIIGVVWAASPFILDQIIETSGEDNALQAWRNGAVSDILDAGWYWPRPDF